jgi:DNA-binding Lrp family transcriptional regulator
MAALETSGTLLYDVDLLPERLGYHFNAMLWLTVAPQHLHDVGERIAAHDEIALAAAMSGRNNLMAVAFCRDVDDLYRYLAQRLAAITAIQTYDVSIRTQRLKQSASLIAHGTAVGLRAVRPGRRGARRVCPRTATPRRRHVDRRRRQPGRLYRRCRRLRQRRCGARAPPPVGFNRWTPHRDAGHGARFVTTTPVRQSPVSKDLVQLKRGLVPGRYPTRSSGLKAEGGSTCRS